LARVLSINQRQKMFMGRLKLFGPLLVLSLVGLSSGDLEELKSFRAEPWNEVRREHTADVPLEEALRSLHQVSDTMYWHVALRAVGRRIELCKWKHSYPA